MKNKLFLILTIAYFNANAQHSRYYTVNANINENVNISGNVTVNKNISTIDYGKLALANAENEKTRLENLKYQDEKQKLISLEISSDPSKAYDYGYQNTFEVNGEKAKPSKLRKFKISYRVPHNSFFVLAGTSRFENVSSNNITTEIIIYGPEYNKENDTVVVEKISKMEEIVV
ncbi:hypothetical protein ACFSX9_02170 [Flavobacterium ardleyense]|uniref:Uncharacterized protein n=1 Tax=Flavobacterium ardleyense TaxID=2038737 RepID=A0ABW5Z6Q2_9FLAO